MKKSSRAYLATLIGLLVLVQSAQAELRLTGFFPIENQDGSFQTRDGQTLVELACVVGGFQGIAKRNFGTCVDNLGRFYDFDLNGIGVGARIDLGKLSVACILDSKNQKDNASGSYTGYTAGAGFVVGFEQGYKGPAKFVGTNGSRCGLVFSGISVGINLYSYATFILASPTSPNGYGRKIFDFLSPDSGPGEINWSNL